MRVPFVGGQNTGISTSVDAQILTGYYVETDPRDERSPRYAVPQMCLTSPFQVSGAAIDIIAMHYINASNLLICLDSSGTIWEVNLLTNVQTSRGSLPGFTSCVQPPQMFDNGKTNGHQLLIIGGITSAVPGNGGAWSYNLNSHAITQLNGAGSFPANVSFGTQQDTFGILVANDNTCEFYVTASFDYTTLPAGNFAQAQTITDKLVTAISDNVRLYLLGATGMEVWYNSGAANFTFTRIPGAVFPIGCAAGGTAVKVDNSIIFLGTNEWGAPSVFQVRGMQTPQRISTAQIDWQLNSGNSGQVGFGPDAWAFAYKERGHEFYVLNTNPVTGNNFTYVYDTTTGEWHSRDDKTRGNGGWPAGSHVFIPSTATSSTYRGAHLFGAPVYAAVPQSGFATGTVLQSTDETFFGLFDNPVRTLISPHLNDEQKRLFINAFQVNFNAFDSTSSQRFPLGDMTLSWSKQNPVSFSSSATMSVNAQRAIVRRLGWGRDWVFKLDCTGMANPPIIMDGFATISYRTEGSPGAIG